MDTFDFARRAELLGIGRWGNKLSQKTKTPWGGELGHVLVDVLLGPESTQIQEKARELAQLCNHNGGGRAIAAEMILREARERVPEEKEEDLLSRSSGSG